jgi:hypothetical protein
MSEIMRTFALVKTICFTKPNTTMTKINKNIEGYEMVKNVVEALGCQRTNITHLFAVKRNSRCGFGNAVGSRVHRRAYPAA